MDVSVITTASLPWRTGPAYLSLWQAAGLAAQGLRVAYGFPWIPPTAQRRLWQSPVFQTPEAQAAWLAEEALRLGCPAAPTAFFPYRGLYSRRLRGIVPGEDIFGAGPAAHVMLLAEPEHLCWFPATRPRRRVAARHVIGLVMTNYGYYVARSLPAPLRWLSRVVEGGHRVLIRRHTDLIIPLSPAVSLPDLNHPVRDARVTGVLPSYAAVPPVTAETRGVYFLGRLVWDKGLAEVIDMAAHLDLPIDIYGNGPDEEAIRRRADDRRAPVRFLGPSGSPWTVLPDYRVFFNPSLSEVLCTATADALVAGRHVVLPDCPANEPFLRYPNAHGYRTPEEAVRAMQTALATQPEPPTAIRHDFDWQNACRTLRSLWEGGPGDDAAGTATISP